MRQRSLIRRIGRSEIGRRLKIELAYFSTRLLVKSLRIKWIDHEIIDELYRKRQPFIFAYWHSDLILATQIGGEEQKQHPIAVMSSQSRDGQIIGNILERLGLTVVSGSSRRGGMEAFLTLAKHFRAGLNGSIAVDGPRGPRHIVKPGVIRLAQLTGHAILPCGVGYKRLVHLKTWDRLRLPCPFTEVTATCSEPMFIDSRLGRDELAGPIQALQSRLMDLRKKLPYNCVLEEDHAENHSS